MIGFNSNIYGCTAIARCMVNIVHMFALTEFPSQCMFPASRTYY